MTLIKSISGIRGTIGGRPGDNLTPVDIVKFTAAFASWIRAGGNDSPGIVIGRDARISGPLVSSLVSDTLRSMGINVRDLGLASTPTVEMAVAGTGADGGIIVTASHNPAQWNALKLLNARGEFIGEAEGEEILRLAAAEDFEFAAAGREGRYVTDDSWNGKHIDQILRLDLVDVKAIEKAGFTVAVDCVNSVGGIIVPQLLKALGIKSVIELNTTPDGIFPHNPEPLPENLGEISALVADRKADLGLVVDPDVDRLAIICEDGSMFGEEYTLVAVADFILRSTPGSTVSNLSSTRALKDVTEKHGCRYFSSPVGEVHVVEEMKARNAVIGGEGNGGIIYPALHYGRDALAGIALFLTHLALSGMKCSELRGTYPSYWIAKKKLELDPQSDLSHILQSVRNHFSGMETDERDGLRIDLPDGWFHLRKSNTEPVMRIYAEGRSEDDARLLAERVISIVKKE